MSYSGTKWTDCQVCDAAVKVDNHEEHVRVAHPEEYTDVYPGAYGDPWVPCQVCHEWHDSDEAVTEHIAREHPAEFDAEAEGGCLLCLRDGFDWDWRNEVVVKDNVYSDNGEYNARMLALHATKELPEGAEVSDEQAVEHVDVHLKNVGDHIGARRDPEQTHFTSNGELTKHPKLDNPEALQDHIESFARDLAKARRTPTVLELAFARELEEGESYTAKEVARETGFTRRHVHRAWDDLVAGRLVKAHDDSRPKTLVPSGNEPLGSPEQENDDPGGQDPQDVELPTDHIDRAWR